MILVVAALKGGVGKTTTSVYLSALASSSRRWATLIDADPQASAAEWLDENEDPNLERVSLVEAPTERMMAKALEKVEEDEWAIVDSPPGNDRMLARAMSAADVVVGMSLDAVRGTTNRHPCNTRPLPGGGAV